MKRWDRTAFFVDKTLDFLRRHQDTPCFVNLWPDDPHTPWVPARTRPARGISPTEPPPGAGRDRPADRPAAGRPEEPRARGDTLVIFTERQRRAADVQRRARRRLRGSKLEPVRGRHPDALHRPLAGPRAGGARRRERRSWPPSICSRRSARWPGRPCRGASARRRGPVGRLARQAGAKRRPLFWEYGRNDEFFTYPRPQATAARTSPSARAHGSCWSTPTAPGASSTTWSRPAERSDLAERNARPRQSARRAGRVVARCCRDRMAGEHPLDSARPGGDMQDCGHSARARRAPSPSAR